MVAIEDYPKPKSGEIDAKENDILSKK